MALTVPDTSTWLAEDVGSGDVTTSALIDEDQTCKAVVLAKETGVICGLDVAAAVNPLRAIIVLIASRRTTRLRGPSTDGSSGSITHRAQRMRQIRHQKPTTSIAACC